MTAASSARQVVLLLKGSDRVAHDLCHAFDACGRRPERPPGACLALRKFHALRLDREFRCFMHDRELVGARMPRRPRPAQRGELLL